MVLRVTARPDARLLPVNPMPRRLSQAVTLQCLDARGRTLDLPALLAYDPADPWAIEFTFGQPSGPVRWLIGRDLLLDGMTEPAGEGDVIVWPSIDEYGAAAVVLELSSPHGRLLTELSSRILGSFLARTLAVVPRGEERIDLDLLVEALTGSQTQ